MTRYEARSARDAQEMGYGDRGYHDYLEQAAKEHRNFFLRNGDEKAATEMMTRTLGEALRGNDGV